MTKHSEAWSFPVNRLELEPLIKIDNYNGPVQITIGIPAYKREEKLIRCLESVARQKSRPFKVIISNDDPTSDISELIRLKFNDCFPILEIYQQPQNLGSLANFNFLLSKADTEYFMWLANDDEISETWVEDLANELDADKSLAGAMGLWICGTSPESMTIYPQIKNDNPNTLLRLIKFIWHADDAFFYGIFRREVLRRGNFPGYFWPNEGYIRNWCYVFLIGPILNGRIKYTNTCEWRNHDYGVKYYPSTPRLGVKLFGALASIARRINVHYLYFVELFRVNWALSVLIVPVSIFALLREAVVFVGGFLIRKSRALKI